MKTQFYDVIDFSFLIFTVERISHKIFKKLDKTHNNHLCISNKKRPLNSNTFTITQYIHTRIFLHFNIGQC